MGAKKKVLIYIPTATAKHDSKAVEGLYYLLSDCWNVKSDGYEFFLKIGTKMNLLDSRNEAVEWALRQGMDWILWLDDDMVIPSDVWLFTQLKAHNKDITAPLFFTRVGVKLPLIFKERKINENYAVLDYITDYKKGLLEVDAVGFGCVLINMEVFRKMKKPYFQYTAEMGEDIYFCMKARKAGFKIYCDTNIVIGHLRPPEPSDESTYDREAAEKHLEKKNMADKVKAATYRAKVGDKSKVDVIMPCYKNYEITKKAIESFYIFTDNSRFKMICINDGTDHKLHDLFVDLAKRYDNFSFIETQKAEGCVKGVNKAIDYVTEDYILICDNDIEIKDHDWLHAMISAFGKNTGVVVPISNFGFGLQSSGYNKHLVPHGFIRHNSKVASGFFEMIKRETLDKVGKLDERFGLGYNVDLDLSIRVREAGYNIVVARDVYIYHHGSQSIKQVTDTEKLEKDTRKLLEDKWGKDKVKDLITLDVNQLKEGGHG